MIMLAHQYAHFQITYDDLPAWVVDPGFQRAEWINALVRQLWPSLDQLVRTALEETARDENILVRE